MSWLESVNLWIVKCVLQINILGGKKASELFRRIAMTSNLFFQVTKSRSLSGHASINLRNLFPCRITIKDSFYSHNKVIDTFSNHDSINKKATFPSVVNMESPTGERSIRRPCYSNSDRKASFPSSITKMGSSTMKKSSSSVSYFSSHSPHRLLIGALLLLLLQNNLGLMAHAFRDNLDLEKDALLVDAVAGLNATLPCIIRIPANDSPLLTLWYLGEDETPVYSYDQRTGVSGTSWADPRVFGGRAHYLAHLSPPAMLIMRVGLRDANFYRCRIDFHNSNSREAWVRLNVVVPPERVDIIKHISPVVPGQRNDVVCSAIGGKPSPSVVWIQNGVVVDPNSTVGKSGTYNKLEVPASRQDLNSPFTCQATNNNITPPVYNIYTRNVTSGPTRMVIESSDNPLVVGSSAQITCRAFGSNPPATVTWYHQGNVIKNLPLNVTVLKDQTVSVIRMKPGRHHHGRQLLCRAENPSLPLATLEDIVTLNVAYRPEVQIKVGWPTKLELLTEGSDMYLECLVDSNPPPYKIQFFHNGIALNPNMSEVMVMEETTFAIQHVTRGHSGNYHCIASNVQGDSASKNITINVRFVPVCATNSTVVGAAIGQMTSLKCVLHAYPTDLNFTWMFNNESPKPRIIDSSDYTCEGVLSTLYFRPTSPKDYGVLSCYGSNNIGIQQQPCTFHIVPAGPPEGVKNCSVDKLTPDTISVTCQPGTFNGGHPQQFFHQVRLASSGQMVLNKTSDQSFFEVNSLDPGERYVVSVVAFNVKGKAPPRQLHVQTLQPPRMHISLPSRPKPRRFIWILGICSGVLLTLGLLLGVLWIARGKPDSHTLRAKDVDMEKPVNTAELPGETRGANDSLCVNGLMTQTIYDSTGRYRGFAHIKQIEHQQLMNANSANQSQQQPSKPDARPTLQSRLSFLRKDSSLTKGSKDLAEIDPDKKCAKETTETNKSNNVEHSKGKELGEKEETEDTNRSRFAKWKWVVNHVNQPSGESNRFLDLCRLAQSKQSQDQNQKNTTESVL